MIALVALVFAGCGGNSPTNVTKTTPTVTDGSVAALTSDVLTKADKSGYVLYGSTTTDSTDAAWAQIGGLNPIQTNADIRGLKRDGFEQGISQEFSGFHTPSEGVSQAAVFSSEAGAQEAELGLVKLFKHNTRRHKPFSVGVPGIPGAQLWQADNKSHGTIAQTVWTEGDCLLSITNAGIRFPKALRTQEIAAAQSIYNRTGGQCG